MPTIPNTANFSFSIVITGSIATGKSMAIAQFNRMGYSHIDADKIAHKILDNEINFIHQTFGEQFITNDTVNRKPLGELIFNDLTAKQTLEAHIHPLIINEIHHQCHQLEEYKKLYFIDIPLFFEKKLNLGQSMILLIYAPLAKQLERLMQRDGFNHQQAMTRIQAQLDIEQKRQLADYIIDNSQDDIHSLAQQCQQFIKHFHLTFYSTQSPTN